MNGERPRQHTLPLKPSERLTGAADAAIVHLKYFFLGLDDQSIIHPDFSELQELRIKGARGLE